TVRAAKRSRKIRRLVRARLTTSGRAGVPGPPAVRVSALIATLLDLVLLFLRDGRGDREVAVLDDTLLPLARNDELDVLAGLLAHSPVSPSWPHVRRSSFAP